MQGQGYSAGIGYCSICGASYELIGRPHVCQNRNNPSDFTALVIMLSRIEGKLDAVIALLPKPSPDEEIKRPL